MLREIILLCYDIVIDALLTLLEIRMFNTFYINSAIVSEWVVLKVGLFVYKECMHLVTK